MYGITDSLWLRGCVCVALFFAPAVVEAQAHACVALVERAGGVTRGLSGASFSASAREACASAATLELPAGARGEEDSLAYLLHVTRSFDDAWPCDAGCSDAETVPRSLVLLSLHDVFLPSAFDALHGRFQALTDGTSSQVDLGEILFRSLSLREAAQRYDALRTSCIRAVSRASLTGADDRCREASATSAGSARQVLYAIDVMLRQYIDRCAAGTYMRATSGPRRSTAGSPTRLLVVADESSLGRLPLTLAELDRVTQHVREVLAGNTPLPVVPSAETRATVEDARRGRARSRPVCARPLSTMDAYDDALPDAASVLVQGQCLRGTCTLVVPPVVRGRVEMPEMRARVERPEDLDSWLEAVSRLETITPPPRGGTGGSGIGGGGGSRPTMRLVFADAYGDFGEAPTSVLERSVRGLFACAPDVPSELTALLAVDAQGRVRVLRAEDTSSTGARCRTALLGAIRFGRGENGRRILARFRFEPAASPSPRRTTLTSYLRYDDAHRIDANDVAARVESALERCASRTRRDDFVSAGVSLTLGGEGRVVQADVTTGDATLDRCVRDALFSLETTCPNAARRPVRVDVRACYLGAPHAP